MCEIKGKQVCLRPTTEADLDLVLTMERDPNNAPFVRQWPREKHLDTMRDENAAHMIIENNGDANAAGYVILFGLTNGDRTIEFRRIVVDDKGHGVGRETVRLVKKLAFEQLQAHRLWLDVMEHNNRAFELYGTEGFTIEGTQRESLKQNDRFVSLRIMSMLEDEYRTLKPAASNGNGDRAGAGSDSGESWQAPLLSHRTGGMKANMIREILKVVAQPGMISLAGGLPAPESFPIKIMEELASAVLKDYSWRSLQYGPTEGFGPLREALAGLSAKRGLNVTADEVIITSGSQGSLDALGRILISPGDYVAVESPTYLGAITAFNAYEPRYVEIETDDDGVIPDSLEQLLKKVKVKMVYVIPTFQNPSGRTIPLARRKRIAEIVVRHQALLVEDDAYGFVRYRGDDVPPIKTMAPDNVVYLSTLSKTLAPGLRIGFCIAPSFVKKWMVLSKQGVDLHTSSFDQAMAAKYISGGYLEKQLPNILNLYRPRLDAMLTALDRYFPKDFKWSKPNGGMFVWAEGPSGFNTDLLYEKAIKQNVAFVPGRHFFVAPNKGLETMRLNFSMVNEATITKAIEMLAGIIKTSVR